MPQVGQDQAHLAFHTTQRAFRSVELQGKLYTIRCALLSGHEWKAKRAKFARLSGVLACAITLTTSGIQVHFSLFIIKETQQLIEWIRERKCRNLNMQGASIHSVLYQSRELCKLSPVMTKFYNNVVPSA
jgi:hypothetical protein